MVLFIHIWVYGYKNCVVGYVSLHYHHHGHKVIHHSHITREIYGYVHNFCNKKVREMMDRNSKIREVADNNGKFFSCMFHNGSKFDMTFLAKGI